MGQAPFADGDTLTWNIQANAQSLPFETQCGTAKNKYQSFNVFKDDKHVVWEQNGWAYETIYWVQ